jgi:DNA processing protein
MKPLSQFPIQQLDAAFIEKYFGNIPQAPKQMFIRGNFPMADHLVFLTIVGSRNITNYGQQALQKLVSGLRGYPIVVVSGLALGTDGLAHKYAIEAGLSVIAFPGSGLGERVIAPRTHYILAQDILNHGGCLLSEYDADTMAANWTFPARNRLMAGISRATLIIEGTHKSGSRITTRLATEYDRDVLALPGSILSEYSEGPNELIRMGATPITCSADILEALGFTISESAAPMMDLFSQCTPDEETILSQLGSPMMRGNLIRSTGLPIHKANILLSQMEMKGLIKESDGEVRRV